MDDPDSARWTVLEGERWTVERENAKPVLYKDGKGREEKRVSKRGGGEDGTKWMTGRLLASAGGGTTIAGTSAGALTVAAGSGKGCERGGRWKDVKWARTGRGGKTESRAEWTDGGGRWSVDEHTSFWPGQRARGSN